MAARLVCVWVSTCLCPLSALLFILFFFFFLFIYLFQFGFKLLLWHLTPPLVCASITVLELTVEELKLLGFAHLLSTACSSACSFLMCLNYRPFFSSWLCLRKCCGAVATFSTATQNSIRPFTNNSLNSLQGLKLAAICAYLMGQLQKSNTPRDIFSSSSS